MHQLKDLVSRLSIRQRISILLAAVLVAAGIFGLVHWKRESDFKPLYSGMAPEDAAAVTQKLKESGVDFRLSETGSTVSVPSSKLAESRLALAASGLPKSGRIGFELFDKTNFGATDFVEHINYKRALEGELERSIMSLAEVEQARVHLTMQKESVFLEKEQPAKASVMLKLRPGARVAQQNVLAITNLVAGAVEGLGPEAVSIVDMNGNLLNRPRRTPGADGYEATGDAFEARQQLERELIAKIHSTLEPLLGPDRFRAGVSVDYDLTSGDQQEETFDPTRSVMMSSQKSEDAAERALASGGIPGTASNLPGGAAPIRAAGPSGSRRTENVTFQTSRIIKHTRIPQGIVRRMSLAVLVDHRVRWEGLGASRRRIVEPPPAETMKTIRELVAAATGFNSQRGDQLTVESLAFETSLTAPPTGGEPATPPKAPGSRWLQVVASPYFGQALGGIAVLMALAGFIFRLRKRAKPARTVEVAPQLEGAAGPSTEEQLLQLAGSVQDSTQVSSASRSGRTEIAARARELAQNDITTTVKLVRSWLGEEIAR